MCLLSVRVAASLLSHASRSRLQIWHDFIDIFLFSKFDFFSQKELFFPFFYVKFRQKDFFFSPDLTSTKFAWNRVIFCSGKRIESNLSLWFKDFFLSVNNFFYCSLGENTAPRPPEGGWLRFRRQLRCRLHLVVICRRLRSSRFFLFFIARFLLRKYIQKWEIRPPGRILNSVYI